MFRFLGLIELICLSALSQPGRTRALSETILKANNHMIQKPFRPAENEAIVETMPKTIFTRRKSLSRGLWLKTMALTASQCQKHSHGYALWKLWKLYETMLSSAKSCVSHAIFCCVDRSRKGGTEPNRFPDGTENEPV